jgi:hypothetical protein
VSSTELFAYESSYPGSFVNTTTGSSNPIAMLYSDFLPELPARRVACSVTQPIFGLYELAGENPNGANVTVLIVNTNPDAVRLNWTFGSALGIPLPGGAASSIRWAPNESAPTPSASTVPAFLQVTIPSGGLWLWHEGSGLGTFAAFHGPPGRGALPTRPGGESSSVAELQPGVLTATRVSVPLMPGTRRTRWSTMSRASLTCPAWIFTMRSKGPVTASTSTTWGICRTRLRTSSRRPTSVSTSR